MKVSLYLLVILFIKSSFYSFTINKKKKNINTSQVNLLFQLNDKEISDVEPDLTIDLKTDYNNTYYISADKSYVIITHKRYFTIIKSSKDNPIYNYNLSNIGETYISKDDNYLYINPYKNLSQNGTFKTEMLDTYNKNDDIKIFFENFTSITNINQYIIIIFRSNKDYFFYTRPNLNIRIWMTKYKENMFYYDIIKKNNTKYFNQVNDNLIVLEKKNIYIISLSSYDTIFIFYIFPFLEQYTQISNHDNDFVYLESNKNYHLEFLEPKNRLIKLEENSINSNIKIKVDNKETILNKINPYFEIVNSRHLELKSENSFGLIQFLYINSNFNEMNVTGFKTFNISGPYSIRCMDLSKDAKQIKLLAEDKIFPLGGYTIYPYIDYYENLSNFAIKKYGYENYEYYPINTAQRKLIDNETFVILLIYNSNEKEVRITIDYQTNFEFKLQIIILITIIIVLFSFFIILILFYYKKCCFKP